MRSAGRRCDADPADGACDQRHAEADADPDRIDRLVDDAPSSYAYQWQRDTGGGFGDIDQATQPTYVPGAGDLGATLRVMVMATNGDGASTPGPRTASGRWSTCSRRSPTSSRA